MHTRRLSTLGPGAILALFVACVAPNDSWNKGAQTTATPQRPTYSNNVFTTAPGTLEVQAGLLNDPSDYVSTPTEVKYGLNDRSEMSVGFSTGNAVEGAGVGFGDVQLAWRQRLTEIELGHLALAYQAVLNVPTGNEDKGLGTGEFDAFLAGIGTLPMRDWSTTGYAQLGLIGDPNGSGADVQLSLAGAADHAMGGGAGLFGELAGVFTPDQNFDSIFTTLGGTWSPAPGLVLDTGIVLGLSNDAPDFQFVIGLTRNLGPAAGYAPRGIHTN